MNDLELAKLAREWEALSLEGLMEAVADQFAPRLALATGFGMEGCVLIDVIGRKHLPIDVFFLDTGLLFAETHALRAALEARYGLQIRAVQTALTVEQQAAAHGTALWERDPDRCCELRKVEPLRGVLGELDAWVTAIRREQSPHRAQAGVIERDAKFGLLKVNPLAAWSTKDVWSYCQQHAVPINPLYERGYASIGCEPCTTPILTGEDERAGRWRGRGKTECGLHLPLAANKVGRR